jgi:hypothetical protein
MPETGTCAKLSFRTRVDFTLTRRQASFLLPTHMEQQNRSITSSNMALSLLRQGCGRPESCISLALYLHA